MKRLILFAAATLAMLAAASAVSSCIYERPYGDDFYRTLWKSDEVPLGPFDASELTLEFLCGGGVALKTVSAARTSEGQSAYGRYAFDGSTATFSGLSLTYYADSVQTGTEYLEGIEEITGSTVKITFLEAHRNGDTLFLLWRVDNMLYPFTTAMRRLSAYE